MFDFDKKAIGQRIKEIREDKDIRQGKLAKALNLSTSSISKIENGQRQIKTEDLEIIAKALDVGLDDIISVDKVSESIDVFISLFKTITTSKEYPIEKGGVILADNLLLKTDKQCIVLTAYKPIFDIIREIAELNITVSKIDNPSKREKYYSAEIKQLKQKYKNTIKLKKESYFLISKEELAEIIEENVSREIKMHNLLNSFKKEY